MQIDRVKGKVFEERAGFPIEYGPDRTDKQPGFPLVPHEAYRDLVTILLLTAISFILTALVVPGLETPRNPAESEAFTVPDWYVLFSFGLLKFASIIPEVQVPGILGLPPAYLSVGFWGFFLTQLPLIFLVILPFIDRGRESRPAKAPLRSAFGIAFLIVWLWTTSMYSINNLMLEKWPVIGSDDVLKAFLITLGAAIYILYSIQGYAAWGWIAAFLTFAVAGTSVPAYAATRLPERAALRLTSATSLFLLFLVLAVWFTVWFYVPPTAYEVLVVLIPNMHTVIAPPVTSMILAYVGLRRPYSTYEYLLNECYQCGKCHPVGPVTKVEDDALGGLNL